MTSGSVTPLPWVQEKSFIHALMLDSCGTPYTRSVASFRFEEDAATATHAVNTHPALVKALEEAKKKFQFVYENDLTQYEHHQPRRDGKRPSDTPEKGTIWRTPREIAKAEIINIDAALTAAKASGKE